VLNRITERKSEWHNRWCQLQYCWLQKKTGVFNAV